MNFNLQYITLAAISLASLGFMPVQAQRPLLNQSRPLTFVPPPPPPNIGAPGKRTGAGKRGCKYVEDNTSNKLLTALVPVTKGATGIEVVLGLTTLEHPTFWFYVPYRAKDVHSAKFVLRTEENKLVHQSVVTLPENPGVVSFRLPPTEAPLEIGKRYHWYFKIYCEPEQPPIFTDGLVQRIAQNPAFGSQLEKATARERVALYVANGIWHEALTTLAEFYRTDPENAVLAKDWAEMLHFVGLDAIATEPIVPCCTPQR